MKFKVFSSHGNRVSHKRYDVENVSQGWIVWTSDSIPWESSSSGRATRHQWFWNRKMFARFTSVSEQYRKDVINGSEKEFSDEREPPLAGSPDTLNLLSHTIHFHSSPLQLWHSYRLWACDSRGSWHFIFVNLTCHYSYIFRTFKIGEKLRIMRIGFERSKCQVLRNNKGS